MQMVTGSARVAFWKLSNHDPTFRPISVTREVQKGPASRFAYRFRIVDTGTPGTLLVSNIPLPGRANRGSGTLCAMGASSTALSLRRFANSCSVTRSEFGPPPCSFTMMDFVPSHDFRLYSRILEWLADNRLTSLRVL